MKRLLIPLTLIFSFSILTAQSKTVRLDVSTIKVYQSAAEIIHEGVVNIEGVDRLIITDLAERIIPSSITIESDNGVKILSVNKRLNYLQPVRLNKNYLRLKGLLDSLNTEADYSRAKISSLKDKLKFLSNITSAVSLSFNEAKKLTKYYYEESERIKNKLFPEEKNLSVLLKKIERVKNQIAETEKRKYFTNEIIVDIKPSKVTSSKFTLRYLANSASWKPVYDLRTDGLGAKPTLVMKASVFQKTGLNWEDCKIIFSSRNLNQSNTKPELDVWYVDFYRPRYLAKPDMNKSIDSPDREDQAMFFSVGKHYQFSREYEAELKFQIPSNNKPHYVTLASYELDAEYQYYAVPKLDKNAFLTVKIREWENLNLLSGNVSVYFEGNYIGESFLNTYTTSKELTISLGRDNDIVVDRNVEKDYTESKIFSDNLVRTFEVRNLLKNNNNAKVDLIVEENIPVSKQEDIYVELLDAANGKYNSKMGRLTWKVTLLPNEQKEISYKFRVVFPPDKKITGLD